MPTPIFPPPALCFLQELKQKAKANPGERPGAADGGCGVPAAAFLRLSNIYFSRRLRAGSSWSWQSAAPSPVVRSKGEGGSGRCFGAREPVFLFLLSSCRDVGFGERDPGGGGEVQGRIRGWVVL